MPKDSMDKSSENPLATFCRLASELGGFRSPATARFYLADLFRGIDLGGMNVLDVGAGAGLTSAWAILNGAAKAVALEPASAGSDAGVGERLRRVAETVGDRLEIHAETIQAYDSPPSRFDLVIAADSINHLDEEACIALKKSEPARESYRAIFRKIAALLRPGGLMLLADCTRYNFFGLLGLPAPLARGIEWGKHQTPRTWLGLLGPLGFVKRSLRWRTSLSAGRFQPLVATAAVNFFLYSHFRLLVELSDPAAVGPRRTA